MAIELDPADDRSWDVLRAYTSWSIHVELAADANQVIASLHDCGSSGSAELTADEAVEVSRKLADIAPLVPLHEVRERDKAESPTVREARWTK